MKNKIMFYYQIDNIELTKVRDIYYFRYQKKLYSFEKIFNLNQFNEILKILKINLSKKYFPIIPNIYHKDFCYIDDNWYALFLHDNFSFSFMEDIINIPKLFSNGHYIKKTSWDVLWSKKIDYYEYQFKHIYNMYPIINESFYYFIGMAENAISYIKYNLDQNYFQSDAMLYLCHKRICSDNIFHPKNFVIDYYSREIAEYIKYLFFSDRYRTVNFFEFFQLFSFSYNDYILLYSRLIFPSYYFDIYDEVINHRLQEYEVKKIILRVNEYNTFLSYIYEIICRFVKIPEIMWIKKEML